MHIIYLGDPFTNREEFDYDIIRQLLRYCYHDCSSSYEVIPIDQAADRASEINNADIVVLQITDVWMTPTMELFKSGVLSREPIYIAHASEITDNYNHISSYDYYNQYTVKDLNRCVQGGIPSYLNCIIAPSTNKLFGIKNIWYPYLFNPTVWSTNVIGYMRELIKSNPVLDPRGRDGACMCYKFESPSRNQVADWLEDQNIKITYSGKYRHNDDSLGPREPGYSMINDYYTRFTYSVAVENDFHKDYISEKLIDPLIAGTIPIYYDPLYQFPDKFINRDACMVVNEITDSYPSWDPTRFIGQPIFAPTALDYYDEWLDDVEVNIKSL